MQLIMDVEDTSINIKEKMSTVDQESLSDKPIINGVQDRKNNVPNGNKENIQTKENILDSVSSDNDKKLLDESVISTPLTKGNGEGKIKEEKETDKQEPEEQDINIEEKSIEDEKESDKQEPKKKDINIEEKSIKDEKESDTQEPEKQDIYVEEKSIEDMVEVFDSFGEKEATSMEQAQDIEKEQPVDVVAALDSFYEKNNTCETKETGKNEKSAGGVDAALDGLVEKETILEELKDTENNVVVEKEEVGTEEQTTSVTEGQKVDLEKVNVSEETLNNVNKKDESVEEKTPLVEDTVTADELDAVIMKDMTDNDMIENKERDYIIEDKEVSTETGINLENEVEIEKENVSLDDVNIIGDEKSNDNIENPTENNVITENIMKKADTTTEQNSLEDAESKSDKEEQIEAMEIGESSEVSCDGVDLKIVSGVVNENNEKAQVPMDCEEISAFKIKDVAQTPTVSETPAEITTNSTEISTNRNKDVEEPMECDQINDIATTESFKANDCAVIESSDSSKNKIEELSEQPYESNKLDNKDVPKTDDFESKIMNLAETCETARDKKDMDSIYMECSDIIELSEAEKTEDINKPSTAIKTEILNMDEIEGTTEKKKDEPLKADSVVEKDLEAKSAPPIPTIRLSNTLDILSDDDEEPPKTFETPKHVEDNKPSEDKQCINIEDDDDIMLIDDVDDNATKDDKCEATEVVKEDEPKPDEKTINTDDSKETKTVDDEFPVAETDPKTDVVEPDKPVVSDKMPEDPPTKIDKPTPLVPDDFFKTYRKNLADMTRDELEEFCILKIVESIIDRSSLNEIRSKLKSMAQSIDDYKKKALMLTKQNRDLQVVLKSVQEEQKKVSDTQITPLKITRSVGMQVYMTEKNTRRRNTGNNGIPTLTNINANNANNRPIRNVVNPPRPQKPVNNQQIPVPRLVPANNVAVNKTPNAAQNLSNVIGKVAGPIPNGVKSSPPPPKIPEKRPHNRVQSDTVDLTDDEPPPAKIVSRNVTPPVRLVSPQNLLAARQQQVTQSVNSPRKVYIPISGPQATARPGQTIMLKSVPPNGPRPRGPAPMVRMPQNSVRMPRVHNNTRHPAELPHAPKQYQPPNWKALPPAPDLKLSKVENGIVISWKIDGLEEDNYEEIASYQLYAYQETSSPPNTSLWKKIGDVKALPLPMACTLTQFMAGYKYFFAVRAVDIRSRLGPFSSPGSILLLNKM